MYENEYKAQQFALKWHKDQKYGDKPYSYHLGKVALYVDRAFLKDKNYVTLAMIALLHDVVEDTACTFECIGNEFSDYCQVDELVKAIDAITKRESESRAEYISRCAANQLALKVKFADTLANLDCSVSDMDIRRIEKYSKQLHQINKLLQKAA